jgi:hypothetical protein
MNTILRTSIALSALSLALAVAGPAAADTEMVVVDSSHDDLARGAVIDGGAPLSLAAGQSVTLIGTDGAVVTLTGPFEQPPVSVVNRTQPGDPEMIVALGALLTEHENSTATLGVIRSGGHADEIGPLPDPWFVSVEGSGTRCIRPDVVTFWRQDPGQAASLEIAAPRTGRSAEVDWPAGLDRLEIAGDSFRDGQTYVLSMAGREVALTMHVMPETVASPAEQAGWMALTGCEAQALALLETVR